MRGITSVGLLSVLLIVLMVGCVAAAGLGARQVNDITGAAEAREAEAEAQEAEAEAQRALAEAAKSEQEARLAEARAREAEEKAEQLRADAERIRAEGQKAQDLADAYATRKMADEAARAIRLQGRLRERQQAQMLMMGAVLGMTVVVITALIWALRAQRGGDGK